MKAAWLSVGLGALAVVACGSSGEGTNKPGNTAGSSSGGSAGTTGSAGLGTGGSQNQSGSATGGSAGSNASPILRAIGLRASTPAWAFA